MGEAKKRGTLDQRIQSAEPKVRPMSARERDQRLQQAVVAGVARILSGKVRK